MKCATCGCIWAPCVVTLTANVHERQCIFCWFGWTRSVNARLAEQHHREGREGLVISEFRNWQATRRTV